MTTTEMAHSIFAKCIHSLTNSTHNSTNQGDSPRQNSNYFLIVWICNRMGESPNRNCLDYSKAFGTIPTQLYYQETSMAKIQTNMASSMANSTIRTPTASSSTTPTSMVLTNITPIKEISTSSPSLIFRVRAIPTDRAKTITTTVREDDRMIQ